MSGNGDGPSAWVGHDLVTWTDRHLSAVDDKESAKSGMPRLSPWKPFNRMRRETAASCGGGYLVATPADPAETNRSGKSRSDGANRSEQVGTGPTSGVRAAIGYKSAMCTPHKRNNMLRFKPRRLQRRVVAARTLGIPASATAELRFRAPTLQIQHIGDSVVPVVEQGCCKAPSPATRSKNFVNAALRTARSKLKS